MNPIFLLYLIGISERGNRLSSDISEEGRLLFSSLRILTISFHLFQLPKELSKNNNNNNNNNINYNSSSNEPSSLECLGSWATHGTPAQGSLSGIISSYLHGNLVFVHNNTRIHIITFNSNSDQQQQPPCVELKTELSIKSILLTRDRMICINRIGEGHRMFDFTGINHYEEEKAKDNEQAMNKQEGSNNNNNTSNKSNNCLPKKKKKQKLDSAGE